MAAERALLDRRLVFVVGKGGVGKTTVSAALALAAVKRRKRVLVVELDAEDRVSRLLGVPPAVGPSAAEMVPGVCGLHVEGRAALEEYLNLVIPIRRLLKTIFASRVYQYFIAAAPGLKELMAVGKIFYEVDRGHFDLVVVDCPATGHSLELLRMPKAAIETFPAGIVHREAKRVWQLLGDAERTAVSVVTTAEEMPTNETLDICRQLDHDLRLPGGWLFVNRFHASAISRRQLEHAKQALRGRLREDAEAALVTEVLERADEEVSWSELNERQRRRLEAESGRRLVVLPFLFREEFSLADVELLAERISSEVGRSTESRARRAGGRA